MTEQMELAARMLEWLSRDAGRLRQFMALTGYAPDDMMRDIESPALLRAAMEHLMADEALLLQFCADTGTPPQDCAHALQRLQAGEIS